MRNAHIGAVPFLREGDETVLDREIEAVLIDVEQLVRLGSSPSIEPASRTQDTTEACSLYAHRFRRNGLAFLTGTHP